jgi:hypothetical protein
MAPRSSGVNVHCGNALYILIGDGNRREREMRGNVRERSSLQGGGHHLFARAMYTFSSPLPPPKLIFEAVYALPSRRKKVGALGGATRAQKRARDGVMKQCIATPRWHRDDSVE